MLDGSRRSRGPAFVLVLVIAFASSGCRSPEQKFRAHMERGQLYRQQGKLNEALLEYRNALQLNPKSADVNFEIAQVLSADQKYSEALFYYREAYRLDPKRLDAGMAEASLLIIASPDEAKALIDEVIEKNPTYAPAHNRRADCLITKQDLDGALAAAQKAAELDPADPIAYVLEGKTYDARMQLAETAHAQAGGPLPDNALYSSALAAAGANVPAALYAARASAHAAAGNAPAAMEDARLAMVHEPTRAEFANEFVSRAAATGHLDQASQELGELRAQGKLPPASQEALARVYVNLGRENDATALYEQILAQPEPQNVAGVKNDLAYLLARTGKDLERPLHLAQEAQAQLPQNPDVADTLGFVYLQKRLYDPAVRQFEYAISLAEASNQPTASFPYRRAVALEKAGHRDEAASAYEKALALAPKFPDAPDARSALASIKAYESAQR